MHLGLFGIDIESKDSLISRDTCCYLSPRPREEWDAAGAKWQSLRARVNYGGSSHGVATLALASPSAEAQTHGPRMARSAREDAHALLGECGLCGAKARVRLVRR